MKRLIICLFFVLTVSFVNAETAAERKKAGINKMRSELVTLKKEISELRKTIGVQNRIIEQLKSFLSKNKIKIPGSTSKIPYPKMAIPVGPMQLGSIVAFPNKYNPNVVYVTDEQTMVVRLCTNSISYNIHGKVTRPRNTGTCIIFKGINTDGLTSHTNINIRGRFEVTGTDNVFDNEGYKRTMFILEPLYRG